MIRTTRRVARKARRCERCRTWIAAGDVYLEHVASPDHEDLQNTGWWRSPECGSCASKNGRAHKVAPERFDEGRGPWRRITTAHTEATP